MGLITRPYSYSPNTLIESAKNNSNETTLYNLVNGSIEDANVLQLSEAKTVFSSTGHAHNGGTTGQTIVRRGIIAGLKLSNNSGDATNDIDIAAGACRDSTDARDLILATGITKRLDAAWSVGTNQGGLDTGSIANTTYHVWLIKRSDTGVVDALFSTSATAPTMPTNYDYKRRLGMIKRASGAILLFVQDGDLFQWLDPTTVTLDHSSAANPGTSAATITLLIPTGVRVRAILRGEVLPGAATTSRLTITDLSTTDVAVGVSASPLNDVTAETNIAASARWEVMTNTSAQVRARLSASGAATQYFIQSLGWYDRRERDD